MESDGWEAEDRARLRDDWTRQDVLRRGNVLNCGHCGRTEFYPLDEVQPVYHCRRCGAENALTGPRWDNKPVPVHESRWYYALHPAVEDLVKDDGDVPLLSTRALRRAMARPPLVYPEFEVFLIKTGVAALAREGPPMLKVVQEDSKNSVDAAVVRGGSLLDEIVRDGARAMLAAPCAGPLCAVIAPPVARRAAGFSGPVTSAVEACRAAHALWYLR